MVIINIITLFCLNRLIKKNQINSIVKRYTLLFMLVFLLLLLLILYLIYCVVRELLLRVHKQYESVFLLLLLLFF
jgi:cell division protein FtsI/penicillin-binding protein 2